MTRIELQVQLFSLDHMHSYAIYSLHQSLPRMPLLPSAGLWQRALWLRWRSLLVLPQPWLDFRWLAAAVFLIEHVRDRGDVCATNGDWFDVLAATVLFSLFLDRCIPRKAGSNFLVQFYNICLVKLCLVDLK